MTELVTFFIDSFDGIGGICFPSGDVGFTECFSLSWMRIRYLDLTRRAMARSSSTFLGPSPRTSSPTRFSVRSMISEKSKTVTFPSCVPGIPPCPKPSSPLPPPTSLSPNILLTRRSRPISTHTSHNRSKLTSCNTNMALGSINIFQNGFALSRASILSIALEKRRNLASMSVMLMQVIPKGRTEASSVIISARVRMVLSLLLFAFVGVCVVGDGIIVNSAFGLGTNREWTAGQLSTM
mmetsp:Transcript_11466/g.25190  ORF Transcript_11466/g.25190 Transcript_11466/m.25190 type:complete len:238 (+) Transcript_11466:621-1334(+)